MADRYWVGGSGDWDATTTTNWSDTSGGTPGASAPTLEDNVIFDENSNVGTDPFTVTVIGISTAPSVCNDFTTSSLDGVMTLTMGATANLDYYGSMTLPATNFTVSGTVGAILTSRTTTSGKTLTTNGVALTNINCRFSGIDENSSISLGSALNAYSITVNAGTFSTSDFNITTTLFTRTTTTTPTTINLGSSTITSSGTTALSLSSGSALTFNAGTSTINCSATSVTFTGGGLTYYNVNFPTGSTATTVTINGDNTFNNLTIIAGTTIKVVALSGNQTINGTLTIQAYGTAVSRYFFRSSIVGTPRTLTVANLGNALADIDFRDINVQGASAPWSGVRLGDCFGNSNISFESANTRYWNYAAGGNWSFTAWASTSGGTPVANNFPLAQDTAIIEDTGLNSGATITMNTLYNIGTWDMSTRTLPMNLTFGNNDPVVYKDFLLSSGVNFTTRTGSPTLTLASQNSTQNLQSNGGNTIIYQIVADCPNTTVKLLDDYRIEFPILGAGLFILSKGTLDLNDKTLSCNLFQSSATSTREIRFTGSNSKINLFGSNTTIWNAGTGANLLYANGKSNVICSYDGSVGRRTITPGTPGAANTINFKIISGSDEFYLTGSDYCQSLDFTGFSGIWPYSSSTRIYGNLIMSSAMTTQPGTGTLNLFGVSYDNIINTNGAVINFPVTIYDSVTYDSGNILPSVSQYTLLSDLTIAPTYTLGFSSGGFSANNYNVSAGLFSAGSSTNLTTRNLVLGSGTWNMTGVGLVWSVGGINSTISTSNSTIVLSNTYSSVGFSGWEYTYNNIIFSSANTNSSEIYGNLTANNITFSPQTLNPIGRKVILVGDNTITVNDTLSLSGNSSNQRTFVLSDYKKIGKFIVNNVAPIQYVDFRHSAVTGNSAPWSGISLGDSGYNSNIIFDEAKTTYWNKPEGGNWSDVAWSTTDGGPVDANNFPLAQDTIVFTNTGLNSGSTVNVDNNYQINNIDFSPLTNPATLNLLNFSNDFYGNISLSPNLNIISTGTTQYFNTKGSNVFITSAGVSWPENTFISFQPTVAGDYINLVDDFTTNTSARLLLEGLNLNNRTLTCPIFTSSTYDNRNIIFGSNGVIKVTGSNTAIITMAIMYGFTYEGTSNVFVANTIAEGTRTINMGNSLGAVEDNALNVTVAPANDIVSFTGGYNNLIYQDGFNGSGGLGTNIFGNIYLANGMSSLYTSSTTALKGTTGTNTITTNGVPLQRSISLGDSIDKTWKLNDDLTLSANQTLYLINSTLDLASKNLTCGRFYSAYQNPRKLSMNAGTIIVSPTVIAGTSVLWQLGVTEAEHPIYSQFTNRNFIFDGSPTNSKIVLNASPTNYIVNFGGVYLNTSVEIANTQPLLFGSATENNKNGGFYKLYNTVNPVTLTLNTNIFIDEYDVTGTNLDPVTIQAAANTENAGYGFISRTGTKKYISNTSFSNVTFYPANTWYAYTTDGNINGGNVNNITFEDTLYTKVARLTNAGEFIIPESTQLDEVNPKNDGKYTMTETGQIEFNEFDETGGISVAGRLHPDGTIQILGEFNEIDGIK